MGHRPGGVLSDLYRQVGTAAPETLIDMAEYGRFVDEAGGKSVLLTADLAQCAAAHPLQGGREALRLRPALIGAC